ncbi:MAG TPA: MucB/RseB C-terminal domain-containing protein, partial [Burkholderiaceae bacterium]|nr:MucB/RseB C-terminal domain-containing protein [Burkholderiaceae bacterium]
ERVDTLTGPARTTVRRNDEVVTFIPEARTTVQERRETLGLFPALLQTQGQSVQEHYSLKPLGVVERVAGFEAEAHDLVPKDDLRFGYRVWSERKTGLVLKIQTLDGQQRVLEQVAFSELNLDVPLKVEALLKLMKNRPGYTVQTLTVRHTTPAEQGWRLRKDVPGFQTIGCQIKDEADPQSAPPPLQWVLSDGLASVSLFIEGYDPKRHVQEGSMASGATRSMAKRMGEHWLTLVGEVPARTLSLFAQELERTR